MNIPPRKQNILNILSNIVRQLHENGVPELDPSLPIVEIDDNKKQFGIEGHHFLGFAHIIKDGWSDPTPKSSTEILNGKVSLPPGTMRYSLVHRAEYVAMRMRKRIPIENDEDRTKTEDDPNLYYELERLIPTFLHELAHCIARACQRWDIDSKNPKKGGGINAAGSTVKAKDFAWITNDHGPEFYEKFAHILRVAEALGIFTLPHGTANKFSMHSLLRFDALDCAVVPLSMIGSTKLSLDDAESQHNDPTVMRALQACSITLSYQVVCMYKGITKPVRFSVERVSREAAATMKSPSTVVIDKLIQASAPKFRLKPGQVKKILNRHGQEVSTDTEFDNLLADEGQHGGLVLTLAIGTASDNKKERS